MGILSRLTRITIADALEREEVLEATAIQGLYWIRSYRIRTAARSGIIIQNPGQENVSVVYHADDFTTSRHGGYDVYGIHLGQVDMLTFLATDGRIMTGHFVDCRADSPTLHEQVTIHFGGDPDRALVIERGIAQLVGMVTLNQPRLYFDFSNPDFKSATDVLNVARGTPIERFPVVHVNRYLAPWWLARLSRKAQRIRLRAGRTAVHPLRFVVQGKQVSLIPRT